MKDIDFKLFYEVGRLAQHIDFNAMFFCLFISKWEEALQNGLTHNEFFREWINITEEGLLNEAQGIIPKEVQDLRDICSKWKEEEEDD